MRFLALIGCAAAVTLQQHPALSFVPPLRTAHSPHFVTALYSVNDTRPHIEAELQKSGSLTLKQLHIALKHWEEDSGKTITESDWKETDELFNQLDTNDDGYLVMSEFMAAMKELERKKEEERKRKEAEERKRKREEERRKKEEEERRKRENARQPLNKITLDRTTTSVWADAKSPGGREGPENLIIPGNGRRNKYYAYASYNPKVKITLSDPIETLRGIGFKSANDVGLRDPTSVSVTFTHQQNGRQTKTTKSYNLDFNNYQRYYTWKVQTPFWPPLEKVSSATFDFKNSHRDSGTQLAEILFYK